MKLKKVKTAFIFLLFPIFLYFLGLILFIFFLPKSDMENTIFDKKRLLVIAYTGGNDRIKSASAIFKKNNDNLIIISGVNPNIDYKYLLSNYNITDEEISCCLFIDFESSTTNDNIATTLKWVNNNKELVPIIVTSSYHHPRVELLLNRYEHNNNIQCHSVAFPDINNINNFKIVLKEYSKYLIILGQNMLMFKKISWPNCI